jgi:hypothetical protein
LSERVRTAVAEEGRAERPGFWSHGWWRIAAAGAVVAALMLVIAPALRRAPSSGANSASVESPAELLQADAVPAFDDDPALTLLADLSAGLDWDAVAEAGLAPADGAVDGVVLALSDEERVELHRLLKEALAGSGA